MLHPGNLRLSRGDAPGNWLVGRVARQLFEGRHWRLTVEIAERGGAERPVRCGRRCRGELAVAFAPNDAVVFVRPPRSVDSAAAG